MSSLFSSSLGLVKTWNTNCGLQGLVTIGCYMKEALVTGASVEGLQITRLEAFLGHSEEQEPLNRTQGEPLGVE